MIGVEVTWSKTPATSRRVSVLLNRPPHVWIQFWEKIMSTLRWKIIILYTTCSFFMSTVAFSWTSCFDPRMPQNKTLLSFEHVTNWSPPFENATWRTWQHHGLHILVFAQNKITSSVWPWRTVASTLGVSSTSRLYSSSQLTASSRRLRKIFNNPQRWK